MGLYKFLDDRAKRLGILDVKLIQVATACFVVLVIKFAPRIIVIRKEYFISILIISLIKPLYTFWFKK
jgi:hypothetical protein